MSNKSIAETSFWVFAGTILLGCFLPGLVLAFPSTNPVALMMMSGTVYVLGVVVGLSLIVLLYSLASMLGVFGTTIK